MTALLRALPGVAAFLLTFLSVYLFVTNLALLVDVRSNPQVFYVVSHVGSAVLAASVPVVFLVLGRATSCRRTRVRRGAFLLGVSSLPVLVANGLYLAAGSREATVADIGGVMFLLLGTVALTITSLVLTIALPITRPHDGDQLQQRWAAAPQT